MTATEAPPAQGRGALWIGGAKAWFIGTQFVTSFGLPNLLTVGQVGDFGITNRAVSLANMVLVTGTLQAVAKFVAERPEAAARVRRDALRIQLALGALASLAVLALSPALARVLGDADLVAPLAAASLLPLVYALYATYVGTLNGLRLFRPQAAFDAAFSTLKTVTLVGAAALGLGVAGLFGCFTAGAAMVLVAAALHARAVLPGEPLRGSSSAGAYRRRHSPLRGRDALAPRDSESIGSTERRYLAFALPVMLAVLVSQWLLSGDLFIVKALSDPQRSKELAAAYYAMLNLALVPTMLLVAVTLVAFPSLARAHADGDRPRVAAVVRQGLRACLLVALACEVVFAASPESALRLVYPAHPEFAADAGALVVLAGAYVLLCAINFMAACLNASGSPLLTLKTTAGIVAAQAIACLVLVPRWGLVGAALGSAAAFLLGAVVLGLLLTRRHGSPVLASTAARAAGATAAAFALGRSLSWSGPMFLVECVLVVLVFAGALVVTGELGRDDLAAFGRGGALRRA